MTKRWGIAAGVLLMGVVWLAGAAPVGATALKISPLRYDTTLGSGEKKKGFVDITNPSPEAVQLKLSVQAFRQTDDNGSLTFFDDPVVQAGILLDYSEVELQAGEALHLAFLIDGTKLPTGDNFAAIFASTVPDTSAPGQQTVKVGTLLMITNGTPSAHEAVIQDLSTSLLQVSDGLRLAFAVHNTAEAGMRTGFSPAITVTAWPYIRETVTGPLVFAGRTRSVDYVKKGNYLGILAISVQTGESKQTTYSLLITGYWRLLLPILLAAVGLSVWFARYVRGRSASSGDSKHIQD